MTNLSNYIIELFKEFKPVTQVILVLIIGGLIFFGYNYVKNENFRKSFTFSFFKFFRWSNRIILSNHDLFFRQKIYDKMIESVRFDSEHKTFLFQTLLKIKVETAINTTREFIHGINKKLNDKELFETIINNLYFIIDQYESRIKCEFVKKYGQINGEKYFKIIYEKKDDGFKDVHNINVLFIQKTIEKISSSQAFTFKQKIYSYLTNIQIALEIAITDCEISFKKLNGEIDFIANQKI